jgi:hypothetical protein
VEAKNNCCPCNVRIGATTVNRMTVVIKICNKQKYMCVIHYSTKTFAFWMCVELLTTVIWPLVSSKLNSAYEVLNVST